MNNEDTKVTVTPIDRPEPNIRKLARALILLARREVARQQKAEQQASIPDDERGAA